MPFHVRPLSIHCRQPLTHRTHVCFGISPFNSYFTTERITDLARWGLDEFGAMHFFVPDVPAAYTLEALGYPPERAAHKARRQGQYLRNKIARALSQLGVHHPDRLILGWSELDANRRYRRLLGEAQRLFDREPDFQAACLTASRWVLDKRLAAGAAPTDDQLRAAVRYFLAELPLFADTRSIVGTPSSVFCYHQCIPFLHQFYRGELPWRPIAGQGFAVLTPTPSPEEPRRPLTDGLLV
ncbi:cyclo(L-tyrosyl-L-tyrosyl) synthase [Amycolatopsis arida]|uniref:Cyclodipeptide synthase n=1 Tax=Amycolatopsis arida TaxID=587909 RepID=A0A1I5ZCZ8_9PSEU|nr:tRNA-dependent cyclodipeptide synthase [Amycolatopsis arida]TDX89537.1 cyclo(L-tyrosyl-L-tyrosyl) synthase [Amycolatopsis arida]SFQ54351.1 cyclo(L-tyrosyl-L-tyrosyl) synthase [Amycolatopsis arida]